MTEGGDARIGLDPATGLNRYFSAPRPRDVLAYASSTANDISPAAYAEAERVLGALGPGLRPKTIAPGWRRCGGRIRAAYGLADDVAMVFAPSGTDLEYVALACVGGAGRAEPMRSCSAPTRSAAAASRARTASISRTRPRSASR